MIAAFWDVPSMINSVFKEFNLSLLIFSHLDTFVKAGIGSLCSWLIVLKTLRRLIIKYTCLMSHDNASIASI